VPKLWNDTIDSHRRAVRDAILETTATLVEKRGLRAVTMSEIAERSGIGRATLYKYFDSVEAILTAWHERRIGEHLAQIGGLAHGSGSPDDRLRAVLEAFTGMNHEHFGAELSGLLHQGKHVARAREDLLELLRNLLDEGVTKGVFRSDVPASELGAYCLHALAAAASVRSSKGVVRLIGVILDGIASPVSHRQRRRPKPKREHRT
jgi:AcrR family transcriptional regulator